MVDRAQKMREIEEMVLAGSVTKAHQLGNAYRHASRMPSWRREKYMDTIYLLRTYFLGKDYGSMSVEEFSVFWKKWSFPTRFRLLFLLPVYPFFFSNRIMTTSGLLFILGMRLTLFAPLLTMSLLSYIPDVYFGNSPCPGAISPYFPSRH